MLPQRLRAQSLLENSHLFEASLPLNVVAKAEKQRWEGLHRAVAHLHQHGKQEDENEKQEMQNRKSKTERPRSRKREGRVCTTDNLQHLPKHQNGKEKLKKEMEKKKIDNKKRQRP